ncbi:MAG: FAD-dependent oxidoreductase, partial [Acidobacteriota bacterium]
MPVFDSRATFFERHPRATAWAALDQATNAQKKLTPGAITMPKGQYVGKRAVVLGAGIAGLAAAYELLAQETGMEVTVLEARDRTGGRCLSLRTGDTFTEDVDSQLFDSEPGETQVVRFERPVGDQEPYLNAGPGRIPSGHKRLLRYLQRFGVEIEIYVMNSESNLVRMTEGPLSSEPLVYRRLNHNVRGWLAQMVYEQAEELLGCPGIEIPRAADDSEHDPVELLRDLMISFGDLIPSGDDKGKYVAPDGDGRPDGTRAGFEVLPEVEPGLIAEAIDFKTLLESEFWKRTSFDQPVDFLWQPTLFQPVGGMDRVQHAFAQQVAALGGTVHLNSPVKSIDWDFTTREFVIEISQVGTEATRELRADYCFSNIPIPFLKRIVSEGLQELGSG